MPIKGNKRQSKEQIKDKQMTVAITNEDQRN